MKVSSNSYPDRLTLDDLMYKCYRIRDYFKIPGPIGVKKWDDGFSVVIDGKFVVFTAKTMREIWSYLDGFAAAMHYHDGFFKHNQTGLTTFHIDAQKALRGEKNL